MEQNIGLVETAGELIGGNQDFLELECTIIIWVFKKIAHGVLSTIRLTGLTNFQNERFIFDCPFYIYNTDTH